MKILNHEAESVRETMDPTRHRYVTPYLQKWTKTVETCMSIYPDEAMLLCNELMDLRGLSGRNGHQVNMYVALWGFGTVHSRNTFLRGLRYALRPRIIYASQKTPVIWEPRSNYFEGLLCFQPGVISIEDLETLVERFHMSIGIADLDSLMSDAMITCVSRVQAGEYAFGNWNSCQNNWYRSEHARRLGHKQEVEARRNLLDVTGLTLTTSNMLSLYYNRQNLEIDLQLMRNHLGMILALSETDSDGVANTMSIATNVEGSIGTQLRGALMSNMDRSYVIQHHLQTLSSSNNIPSSPTTTVVPFGPPNRPPPENQPLAPGVLFVMDLTGP